MKLSRFVTLLIAALFSCASAPAVTIETVPIGNLGNPADTVVMTCCGSSVGSSGYGSVDYNFVIGKFPVTNTQYTGFLNAVAASDPLALYNTNMGSSTHGGIARSGSIGSFIYATKPGMENKPVNFVSWYDAIRFANWLHNGQGGPGTTEDGAYTLLGGTPTPSNGNNITRNPGAKWWLPSEDEWYKASYHKNDGVTGNYWQYPTSSDSVPVAEPPPGGTNSANYWPAVRTVSDVGAYVDSPSPYGTFDQGGNMSEWNESLIDASFRGLRGGSWSESSTPLRASVRVKDNATAEFDFIGFRVASIPEPATMWLGMFGIGNVLLWRRRRS